MKEVGETQRQRLFRQALGAGFVILGLYLFNQAYKVYKN
jgi:hypothetical protein